MNRFKLIWKIATSKKAPKDPVAVEKAQESVRVKALQRQVDTLEDINIEYANQIKVMSSELANHRESNMQDKLIETAINIFAPKSQPQLANYLTPSKNNATTDAEQTTLESGVLYSDNQLMTIAESLGSSTIKQLKGLAFDKFAEVVKSQIPNISETSIKRSREIIEVMEL